MLIRKGKWGDEGWRVCMSHVGKSKVLVAAFGELTRECLSRLGFTFGGTLLRKAVKKTVEFKIGSQLLRPPLACWDHQVFCWKKGDLFVWKFINFLWTFWVFVLQQNVFRISSLKFWTWYRENKFYHFFGGFPNVTIVLSTRDQLVTQRRLNNNSRWINRAQHRAAPTLSKAYLAPNHFGGVKILNEIVVDRDSSS